jgi:hypothetical protein
VKNRGKKINIICQVIAKPFLFLSTPINNCRTKKFFFSIIEIESFFCLLFESHFLESFFFLIAQTFFVFVVFLKEEERNKRKVRANDLKSSKKNL